MRGPPSPVSRRTTKQRRAARRRRRQYYWRRFNFLNEIVPLLHAYYQEMIDAALYGPERPSVVSSNSFLQQLRERHLK